MANQPHCTVSNVCTESIINCYEEEAGDDESLSKELSRDNTARQLGPLRDGSDSGQQIRGACAHISLDLDWARLFNGHGPCAGAGPCL